MKTKDIFKIAQEKINAKLDITPTKLKNTFKVVILALALTSCEKAEELIPVSTPIKGTSIHMYLDHAVVSYSVNDGSYTQVGDVNTQSVVVIEVDSVETFVAMIQYGNRFSTTIYVDNTRKEYGYDNFVAIRF